MTINVTPIPSAVDFGTPAIVYTTANDPGAANTAIRTDSEIAIFNSSGGSTLVSGATGAAGDAAFASRQNHTHTVPTLATGTPTLGFTMQNFVEGGLRCVYMLGAPKASAFSDGDEVGFGQQFTFSLTGAAGTLAPSTTIRGGWALSAGNADGRRAQLSAGDAVLAGASDFTVVYHLRRDSTGEGTSWLGLGSLVNSVQTTADIILFSWARGGGPISCITDRGGSETVTADVATVADDTDVTFRIEVTGDGGTVKFYIDDTLEATHTGATIPNSTSLYIFLNQGSNTSANTTMHIADIFAWRTS